MNIIRIAICALALGLAAAATAAPSGDFKVGFEVPAQPLGDALTEFASQAGLRIVFYAKAAAGVVSPHLSGSYTPRDALKILLSRSDLKYKFIDARTVTISNAHDSADAGADAAVSAAESFRTAQVGPTTSSDSTPGAGKTAASHDDAGPVTLEEITVTAQKRAERLQDVPVPVTAIDADTLIDNNQLRLQDYYTQVPGLSVTPGDYTNGAAGLSIRGITTGGTGYGSNPTVAIVVDDVPYGGSTALGGGGVPPDIDPSELASIEVLRGPQGTLYGASSMGGLLKFVTADPSTAGVSGRVQAGTSSVYNGAELGYSFRGSVNLPLSDTVAVRLGGFTRRDPGYIDNVETGQNGVNTRKVDGGRLSALWRASDVLTLKLSALYQDSRTDGSDAVFVPAFGEQADLRAAGFTLPTGELQQSALRNTGTYDSKTQAYSATLTAKLGRFDLTSLSGYNRTTLFTNYDLSPLYGTFVQAEFGVTGTPWLLNNNTDKFSQELRLAASLGSHVDWLFGLFYTSERIKHDERYDAVDPATLAVLGFTQDIAFSTTYDEYAAFTDFTYHVTDRFDVQVGGRESRNRQTFEALLQGPWNSLFYGIPSPFSNPRTNTQANAFTYLLTPQFKLSPDLMIYARLASGYRPGGPNFLSALGLPPSFAPDKTNNYEIGIKGNALDHRLSFDASLYYIDWKNIQLYLINPATGTGFYTNGSGAKSAGLELSVEARPVSGLTLAGWISLDDAVLTEPFPRAAAASAYGAPGDRLPFTSRYSGHVSVDQEFPLTGRMTGFVGGTASYVGDRQDVFTAPTTTLFTQASTQRQKLPGYAQTDLRAGVRYDAWTLNFFVNNVADKRGLLAGGLGNLEPYTFHVIQPRTVGLSAALKF